MHSTPLPSAPPSSTHSGDTAFLRFALTLLATVNSVYVQAPRAQTAAVPTVPRI
jgi:hypothetical protein